MTIHVENFDLQWKDENLKELFSPFGDVASAAVSMDVFTGRSRGFGFVDMPDESAAAAAIASLHQTEIAQRVLTVKTAEPKKEAGGSYKVGNGGVIPYRFRKN